jgi:hypothetical protein
MTGRLRIASFLRGAVLPLCLSACIVDPTVEERGRARTTHIEFPNEFPMIVGESRTRPTAFYADAAGDPTGLTLNATFVSRDAAIATLTVDGQLQAGLTAGSTYVVVSDGEISDSTLVTVTGDFYAWPDTLRLVPGASRSITVRTRGAVTGIRGLLQTDWQSLDPGVATVNSDGVITATGVGQTKIVARRGTYSAATAIQVASYPRELTFTDFGIGSSGVCALEADGSPWCWGQHQPVDATAPDRCGEDPASAVRCSLSPIRMSTKAFAQVLSSKGEAGGYTGPFALTASGELYRLSTQGPFRTGEGMQFQSGLGGSPACGVAFDNHGFCWGFNSNGEMGIGVVQQPVQTSNDPVEVGGGILWKYFVHASSMCGLAVDGSAYCWGSNVNFETGVGTNVGVLACGTGCVNSPLRVKGELKFTQIEAGLQEVCGLTADQSLHCWGRNLTDNGGPVTVTPPATIVTLFGGRVICGIDAAASAYCLRFPNEPFRPVYQFAKLALPFKVRKIVTGDKVNCAQSATDSRVYCWGTGALGRGISDDTAPVASPVEVWGQRPPA